MTEPVLAARRFLAGLLLGAVAGLWYDLLEPVRRRKAWLADLLFLPGLAWGWLQLMFGICQGDIRMGGLLALLLGLLGWEGTAGWTLRPVVLWFFKIWEEIFRLILLPFKKIFENSEPLLVVINLFLFAFILVSGILLFIFKYKNKKEAKQ